MKHFLLTLFALASIISFAQTHTWTGNGGDTNWNNPDNWDVFTVPDATSSILISGNGIIVDVSANNESGTIVIEANAKLIVNGTLTNQQTITLNNAEIEVIGSLYNNSGTIVIESGAKLVVKGSLTFSNETTITDGGELLLSDGMLEGGTIENEGLIRINEAPLKYINNVTINNQNEILIEDSGTINMLGTTTINNEAGAEINIHSHGGLVEDSGTVTINNDGLIKKYDNGNPGAFYMIFDMNNSGVIFVEEDQTFLFLVGSQDFNNTADGFLLGDGIFDITANFTNNGYIRPGTFNNLGHLDFINNFHFPSNARIQLDIFSPTEYDTINITGSPTLEGNFVINMAGEVELDDEITIISSSNNLTCNLLPQVSASTPEFQYTFDVLCETNTVTLKVIEKLELLNTQDFTKELYLVAYPNPVIKNVAFSYPSQVLYEKQLSLEVYSMLGQKLKSLPVQFETTNVDTSHLSSGLYLVNLVSEKGVLATSKIIIE